MKFNPKTWEAEGRNRWEQHVWQNYCCESAQSLLPLEDYEAAMQLAMRREFLLQSGLFVEPHAEPIEQRLYSLFAD